VRIGTRHFAPRWWAVLLYLSIALAMLSLGRWQLQRADEKIALLDSAAHARSVAPVAVERVDDIDKAAVGHRRVIVRGEWDGERQLLWDNRAHAGRAGYEAIVPVRLVDGRLALVNRGWIAPGPTRQILPDISLETSSMSSGEGSVRRAITLVGLLSRPSRGFSDGPALAADGPWPRVLQYFDYPAIEAALGEPIVPAVVQARIADDTGVFATTDGSEGVAAGSSGVALDRADEALQALLLTPNWRPAASGPEKHYGYAFQWFAMAAALTVIFVVVNLSRKEP